MALINCPECGKELSDTNRKCPHCGYKIKRVNVRKIVTIIGCVVVIGGCTAGSVLYVNSPIQKFGRSLKKCEYENAKEIYNSSIQSSAKYKSKVEDDLKNRIQEKVIEYAAGDIEEKECKAYIDFCKEIIKDDWSSLDNKIDKLSTSKSNYKEGEDFYSQGNFINAMKKYELVVEDDSKNYNDAVSKIDLCKTEYCSQIITKIDEHSKSDGIVGYYDNIKKEVEEFEWVSENKEVKDAFSKYEIDVKSAVIRGAKNNVTKKDYVKAISYLENNIPDKYSNDNDVLKLQKDIKNKIVKQTISKADKYIKKGDYSKAYDIVQENIQYDIDKKLVTKREGIDKKLQEINIAEFKKLKEKLSIVFDSVTDTYTVVKRGYSAKYINISSSINIEARGTISKSGLSDFDLLVGFQQRDWIFTEIVQFSSENYKNFMLVPYSSRYTQVIYGGIVEWMYPTKIMSNSEVDDIIDHITRNEKVTIRFAADGNGSRDHVITDSEKDNIRTMKKFFDMLKKYPYLKDYVK